MVEISVLLPTRNRAHLLPLVFEALERQTLTPDRYEVIAVDDGSEDATGEVLRAHAGRLPLRCFRQRPSGLAAAKNLAVFAARAPLLLFLDDDDVADPDLLRTHLAAHLRHPAAPVAVLGRTELAAELQTLPLMHHVTRVGYQLFGYPLLRPGGMHGYAEFWGGRSSCKRAFLVEHGVFAPLFRFGFEDVELGWRLAPHGLEVLYEPAALSTMIRGISFDGFCRRSLVQGRAQHHFLLRHPVPDIRAYLDIEGCLAAWAGHRLGFRALLDHARRLDALANSRRRLSLPLPATLQDSLDEAYRLAFLLCRAKGMVDAQGSGATVMPAG